MATPECVEVVTLRQCTHSLATGIALEPVQLTNKLFQKGLVPERLVKMMLSGQGLDYDKATKLVMAVRKIVGNSSQPTEKFEEFMNVLNESTGLESFVELVRKQYEDNKQAQALAKHDTADHCDSEKTKLLKQEERKKTASGIRQSTGQRSRVDDTLPNGGVASLNDDTTKPAIITKTRARNYCSRCALTSAILFIVLAFVSAASIVLLMKKPDYLPSGDAVVGNSDVVLVSTLDPSTVDEIHIHTLGDNAVNVSFYQDLCTNSKIGPFQQIHRKVSTTQPIVTTNIYTVDAFYLMKNSRVTYTISSSVPLPCIFSFHNFDLYQRFISSGSDDGNSRISCVSKCDCEHHINYTETLSGEDSDHEYYFVVMKASGGLNINYTFNYTVEDNMLEYDVAQLTPTTCEFSASSRTCSIPLDDYHGNQEVCVLAMLKQDGNFTTLGYTTSSASHVFRDVMSRHEILTVPCGLFVISIILFVVFYKLMKKR